MGARKDFEDSHNANFGVLRALGRLKAAKDVRKMVREGTLKPLPKPTKGHIVSPKDPAGRRRGSEMN